MLGGAQKKIKQSVNLIEAAIDTQSSRDRSGPSSTIDLERLQLWRFLNEDNFNIYPSVKYGALQEYHIFSRDSSTAAVQPPGSANAGDDGGSVFDLPAEEVVLEEARPAQVEAFHELVAYFRNTNGGPQPRPPHGELRSALQLEWNALRDMLRVFGEAIRGTYFKVGPVRQAEVGAFTLSSMIHILQFTDPAVRH